ncbi:MAG: hypothetical protein Q4D14_01325, partial [Bacteroidales bacterium]|nr:hypothetical protein [Bacteroidales bacterium]
VECNEMKTADNKMFLRLFLWMWLVYKYLIISMVASFVRELKMTFFLVKIFKAKFVFTVGLPYLCRQNNNETYEAKS